MAMHAIVVMCNDVCVEIRDASIVTTDPSDDLKTKDHWEAYEALIGWCGKYCPHHPHNKQVS